MESYVYGRVICRRNICRGGSPQLYSDPASIRPYSGLGYIHQKLWRSQDLEARGVE